MDKGQAQDQMSINICEELCSTHHGAFAFSNGQKDAKVFHTGGSKEKIKTAGAFQNNGL